MSGSFSLCGVEKIGCLRGRTGGFAGLASQSFPCCGNRGIFGLLALGLLCLLLDATVPRSSSKADSKTKFEGGL